MIQQNASLDENYFVSSFVSGLKEELKHRVKPHRPRTVDEAYRLAKLNELALEYDAKGREPSTSQLLTQILIPQLEITMFQPLLCKRMLAPA
ncbi:hypothetical protein HRI_004499300 [Hibiscus trionum]|uniref:Uncharacterized protein n=1 Tax=Hibiscus trionum TaxID=183268 RepID=A0A9W7J4A4_HIBTR|nr:hypothetical protein HRI_004499300 [Hibiscus trionum]